MSRDIHTNRNFHQSIISNADQTELSAIKFGSVVIDSGIQDDRIADALDDYDPALTHLSAWQSRDLKLDTAVGDVSNVLSERSAMLKGAYPFDIKDGRLVYQPRKSRFYEFCLLITLAKDITTGEYTQLPRSFERICAVLVRTYLGKHAKAIHVGAPRDDVVGKTFQQAMESVQKETGEWIWDPEQGMPVDTSVGGDEGVDFIVWADAMDARRGHLFVLGQCACGNDWPNKFNDLDLERLKKWMRPLSHVTPVRSFTTPFQMSEGMLRDAQRLAGLVFDRARLAILAHDGLTDPEYEKWEKKLPALCDLVLRPGAETKKPKVKKKRVKKSGIRKRKTKS
ncbi:hypothetical protein [Bradyrhizobium sp. WSM3983]|uniref:hypothetical protein n=1 Tax=Bradyrhizobium sp. WSM3983 TaxID=1038867 RepID=UPI0004878C94|nr:hypothetical protein [Bradyrhizobium sp. WSM3983]